MKLIMLSLSALALLLVSGFTTPLHLIHYANAQNPTIGGVSYTDCGTLMMAQIQVAPDRRQIFKQHLV